MDLKDFRAFRLRTIELFPAVKTTPPSLLALTVRPKKCLNLWKTITLTILASLRLLYVKNVDNCVVCAVVGLDATQRKPFFVEFEDLKKYATPKIGQKKLATMSSTKSMTKILTTICNLQ